MGGGFVLFSQLQLGLCCGGITRGGAARRKHFLTARASMSLSSRVTLREAS